MSQSYARKNQLNSIEVADTYDTGWVSNSDWTLSNFTITHNLNAPITSLIVNIDVSTDGTDNNAFIIPFQAAGNADYGTTIYQTSSNVFEVYTGSGGMQYMTSGGISTRLTTESYYYKVTVQKIKQGIITNQFLQANCMWRADTHAGYGSTDTKIPYFTNVRTNINDGSFTVGNDSTNGCTFTVNTSGIYAITYTHAGAGFYMGISLNSTELTTNIDTITAEDRIGGHYESGGNVPQQACWTGQLSPGDIVRPHNDGTAGTAGLASITFVRIA